VARFLLEPPPARIRPPVAYAAAALALLLGLALLVAAAPHGDAAGVLAGAAFAVVGALLVRLVRRSARRAESALALEGNLIRLSAPGLHVDLPVADVAEVVVDVAGVRCGADRLRFPASGSLSERRYLHGKQGGTALFSVASQLGEPNLALVLRAPITLTRRARSAPGIALAVRDPHAAAEALRDAVPVRVVEHAAAVPDPDLVEIVGRDAPVLRRGEQAATLAGVALIAVGQALLRPWSGEGLVTAHALAGVLLMLAVVAGAVLLARRRRGRVSARRSGGLAR
jgi:hypothetical protein